MRWRLFICCLLCWWHCLPQTMQAAERSSFRNWLQDFAQEASTNGISRNVFTSAFQGIDEPDQEVLKKAAYQPEFTQQLWEYLDGRVNAVSIGRGKQMAALHRDTLQRIEQQSGVEPAVLLAIWSMESSFGEVLKKKERLHYVPQALATLAYADAKRRQFARNQLLAALTIMQNEKIGRDQMYGSWAGAMGHTQFIPTSYLAYAVDMDGDGRKDIWNSVPDALATAANLLKKNGWRQGESWAVEVNIPASLLPLANETKSTREWRTLGVTGIHGEALTGDSQSLMLKIAARTDGPAFLVKKNFAVVKKYNNADSYALAVLLLADQLAGRPAPRTPWARPAQAVNFSEKMTIQQQLKSKGYYAGEVDGYFGEGSRSALKAYQQAQGLTPDGQPSRDLLQRLRQ